MTVVERLHEEIEKLSAEERAELMSLLHPTEDDEWDREMAADAVAGKFKEKERRALEEFKAGRCRDLKSNL